MENSLKEKIPLTRISGTFFRTVRADLIEHVLAPPSAQSAGRYHRLGQPALYMSPKAEWARIAVSGYMREDGLPRVVVPLELEAAYVFDQRDEAACAALGIDRERSNLSWRDALKSGREPESWANADAARNCGAVGILDRSRHISDGWHITLFRWNEPGGPAVRVVGDPMAVTVRKSGPKWG